MAKRFTVEAVFRGIDRVSAPISRMQNRVGKFTRSFAGGLKKLNRGVDSFTHKLHGLSRVAMLASVAFLATGAAVANVINTGARFEQTLVAAAVKFSSSIEAGSAEAKRLNRELGFTPGFIIKGTEEFKRLQDAAAEVGRTTEFTATAAAEALNFLAMAGLEAETAVGALPGVVDLATVAQVDLGLASDIATDTLGAFGIKSKTAAEQQANLARVSDLLVTTSINANTSLVQMFGALTAGAPVAVAAGESIEQVAAMIGIMANAGIKNTKAGRSLKNMIINLAAPSTKAARVLEDLGVEINNIPKGMNRAITLLQRFGEATKDLEDAEKIEKYDIVFGKIAIAASINLASATDEVNSLSQKIKDNVGITAKMAAVMRDTFQGRMNAFKSAIESVKISIFSLTEGPLADLLDQMVAWTRENEILIAQRVSEWILAVVNNLDRIISFLRRVGIGLVAFFTFIVVLKTLVAVLTIVNLLMLANPATLVTIAILGLVAAIIMAVFFGDELMDMLTKLPGIGDDLLIVFTDVRNVLSFMRDDLQDVVDSLDAASQKIKNFMGAFLTIPRIAFSRLFSFPGLPRIPGIPRFHRNFPTLVELQKQWEAESASAAAAEVISPSERTARSIEERSITNTTEVTLRTEPGTSAEVTKGKLGGGLRMQPSGGI